MAVLLRRFPLALSLLLALPALAQTTVTLQDGTGGYSGTSDARIVCCADTNEGAAGLFDLIPEDTTSVLIRFDVFQSEGGPVPNGSTIQSATLSLYRNDGPAAIFEVRRVERAWAEAGVSWINTGAGGTWAPAGAFAPDVDSNAEARTTMPDSTGCPADPPAPASCWAQFDVTAGVSAFSSDPTRNFGWKLAYVSDPDGTQTNSHTPKELYSSDNTRAPSLRPTLTVTYAAPPTGSVPLYMMYRASNTDWLYTTDANERSTAINSLGFADSGIAGSCDPADNGAGAPLYRFWKGPPQNEHFYTTSQADKDSVIASGYTYEGVQCWVWPAQVAGTVPFYRMSRFDGATGDLVHFYTTDPNQVAQKQAEGYANEGIQAYIKPPPQQPAACANPAGGYEGFGHDTTGGAGQPVYHVTSLDDTGNSVTPAVGTLRHALEQNDGNLCIVFDVGGTILLKERLYVHGANVTIDGFTAPSPGITLRGEVVDGDPNLRTPANLIVEGDFTPGNVVIRGIRHRGSSDDGISILGRELRADTSHPLVSNVVIDHVSVTGQGDGAIDVTEGASNVTIQWSILGTGSTDNELNLIQFGAHAVSLHHDLYVAAKARMPGCYDSEVPASGLVCDVRNNLIWNTSQAGTEVRFNATANVINNYYRPGSTAIYGQTIWLTDDDTGTRTSSAYTSGNFLDSADPNFTVTNGDRTTPFAVDPAFVPNTTDATTAARAVRDQAGARCSGFGLDATDQGFIGSVVIP